MYEKLLQKNDFKLIDMMSIDNLLYEGLVKLINKLINKLLSE